MSADAAVMLASGITFLFTTLFWFIYINRLNRIHEIKIRNTYINGYTEGYKLRCIQEQDEKTKKSES